MNIKHLILAVIILIIMNCVESISGPEEATTTTTVNSNNILHLTGVIDSSRHFIIPDGYQYIGYFMFKNTDSDTWYGRTSPFNVTNDTLSLIHI